MIDDKAPTLCGRQIYANEQATDLAQYGMDAGVTQAKPKRHQ